MKTVDFIRLALDRSARATMGLINDMEDQPLTFPTPNGGNHPLWVLGHLAFVEGDVIQKLMLGRPNPVAHWKNLFGIGSEVSAEASRYPPLEEVKKTFLNLRADTLKILDTLGDADLDQPSKAPPELKEFLDTYAKCFLVLILNTMHHRGQVADARRAAGRKPLRM
jgi:uncharacterized damage-inducible protein DinB